MRISRATIFAFSISAGAAACGNAPVTLEIHSTQAIAGMSALDIISCKQGEAAPDCYCTHFKEQASTNLALPEVRLDGQTHLVGIDGIPGDVSSFPVVVQETDQVQGCAFFTVSVPSTVVITVDATGSIGVDGKTDCPRQVCL